METITTNITNAIHYITINRPSKRNALNNIAYQELTHALLSGEKDSTIRVQVLSGAGGYFCGGNDLADFDMKTMQNAHEDIAAKAFLQAISQCQKPIIAGVEGGAVGVGVTMLLHCDGVFVGKSVKMAMPFTALGVCPEGGSSLLIPQRAGYLQAVKYLIMGETFGAQTAINLGVATEIVEDGEAMTQAVVMAEKLCAMPFSTILESKTLLKKGFAKHLQDTLTDEINVFSTLLKTPETQSRISAMLQALAQKGKK